MWDHQETISKLKIPQCSISLQAHPKIGTAQCSIRKLAMKNYKPLQLLVHHNIVREVLDNNAAHSNWYQGS
jgi:hypothetical protein